MQNKILGEALQPPAPQSSSSPFLGQTGADRGRNRRERRVALGPTEAGPLPLQVREGEADGTSHKGLEAQTPFDTSPTSPDSEVTFPD